jgi:hypothetical protein
MAGRLLSILPRFVVLPALALLGTATITFAAETQLTPPNAPEQPQAAEVPAVIVVPDVRRQAYVFAKGTLEDAGLAWRVVGGVKGYAANTVAAQEPLAGTRIYDTGAPLVSLTLARNPHYAQIGEPEAASSYVPTPLRLVNPPAAKRPVRASGPGEGVRGNREVPPANHAKPKVMAPKPKPAAKPKPTSKTKPQYPQSRPPAFTVAGAPKEPLDEMPLPDRAHMLARWLEAHPKPTNASVRYWLYQNAWIVTGARFGWWHGAEALRELVKVDRRAEKLWGVGAKSEANASRALAEVQARSR